MCCSSYLCSLSVWFTTQVQLIHSLKGIYCDWLKTVILDFYFYFILLGQYFGFPLPMPLSHNYNYSLYLVVNYSSTNGTST